MAVSILLLSRSRESPPNRVAFAKGRFASRPNWSEGLRRTSKAVPRYGCRSVGQAPKQGFHVVTTVLGSKQVYGFSPSQCDFGCFKPAQGLPRASTHFRRLSSNLFPSLRVSHIARTHWTRVHQVGGRRDGGTYRPKSGVPRLHKVRFNFGGCDTVRVPGASKERFVRGSVDAPNHSGPTCWAERVVMIDAFPQLPIVLHFWIRCLSFHLKPLAFSGPRMRS